MKDKVIRTLGERVIKLNIHGYANVVTNRETVGRILDQLYSTPQDESKDAQKNKMIETAARLLLAETKTSSDTVRAYGEYPLT